MNIRDCAAYANVSGLTGLIVSWKLATLHELDTVYSYQDALKLGEIITVQHYNQWAAAEAAKKK